MSMVGCGVAPIYEPGLSCYQALWTTNMLGRFAIRAGDFGLVARPCCTCWLSSGHWAQQTSASGVSHPLGNLELHSYGSFMLSRRFLQNLRAAIGTCFNKFTVDDFHYVLTAAQRDLISASRVTRRLGCKLLFLIRFNRHGLTSLLVSCYHIIVQALDSKR